MTSFKDIVPIKLCIISPTFPLPGDSPYIGPDNAVYNLVKGIINVSCRFSINVITIRSDIDSEFSSSFLPNIKVTYLPSIKMLPRSFGDPIVIKNFFKKNKFDLIHAHYPIALSKIMDLKTPKILTLHGILSREKKFVQNPFVSLCYNDYTMYMMEKILPKLDAFVAISPYVIDELKQIGLYKNIKNVFQINNAIDSSFFEVVSNPSKSIIFYPGGVRKLKNQMIAIEAIKLLKDMTGNFQLVLAGDSDRKYLKQVLCKVNRDNCSDFVEYLGSIPRQKILDLYSKASIVYLLSHQEVQPMVILEAMATGTPVIASNIKSIRYLVDDGITGYLVDPKNSQQIAEYTIELLTNKEKRVLMGRNAKRLAEKKYHTDLVSKQTVDMYMKVLGV